LYENTKAREFFDQVSCLHWGEVTERNKKRRRVISIIFNQTDFAEIQTAQPPKFLCMPQSKSNSKTIEKSGLA